MAVARHRSRVGPAAVPAFAVLGLVGTRGTLAETSGSARSVFFVVFVSGS